MATNRQVYDDISESWYGFRHRSRFTTELEEMANRWHGGRLLNIGCAHGPDFIPFKDRFELWGVDFSAQMLKLAQKYAAKYSLKVRLDLADAVSLPYADGSFDCAIAVAIYHNIEGAEQRRKALSELKRVLKPGGEAFITAWNKWQPRFWLQGKEVSIPWKSRNKIHYRYYYLYSYPELISALAQTGFEIIKMFPEKSYTFPLKFFSRNICALVKK
ncbi:MAG TPA: class I SAM-dependent methyltransferase [Dehalococcoidia bacterium]|jgi:ubiquinone/menaquinone biosynthesis C-methylase UbiE